MKVVLVTCFTLPSLVSNVIFLNLSISIDTAMAHSKIVFAAKTASNDVNGTSAVSGLNEGKARYKTCRWHPKGSYLVDNSNPSVALKFLVHQTGMYSKPDIFPDARPTVINNLGDAKYEEQTSVLGKNEH